MNAMMLPAALWLLAAQAPPAPGARQALRVVSWNIHGCEGGVNAIIGTLRMLKPDIVCLQEAEKGTRNSLNGDQAAEIARSLGMLHYSAGSPFSTGGEQHMAILSRVPVQNPRKLDAHTGRIYGIAADIRLQGRTIRFYCVHLTGTYRVDVQHAMHTAAARYRESVHLAGLLEQEKATFVLTGDLNAMPGMAERVELERHARALPSTQPTFPANRPSLRLDEIYCSSDLEVIHSEVGNSRASDHRPLVAEFVLRTGASQPVDTRRPQPASRTE